MSPEPDRAPALSFVIPAFNEEAMIVATLRAIHESARVLAQPYEIVVADDASTDATADLAAAHGARVVRVNNRQIAATRNAGARAARAEVIVFVDADTTIGPAVLAAAWRALAEGAVGGGASIAFSGDMPRWATWLFAVMQHPMRWARTCGGCFMFAKRDAFDAVGGFDEAYYASEEVWLARAMARHGRFVILREKVVTSGRKLRLYSALHILKTILHMSLTGGRALRRRDAAMLWYDGRRESSEEAA